MPQELDSLNGIECTKIHGQMSATSIVKEVRGENHNVMLMQPYLRFELLV